MSNFYTLVVLLHHHFDLFNDNDSILYLSRVQILYICKVKRHICSVFKEAPRNFLVPAIDQKVGVSVMCNQYQFKRRRVAIGN